MDRKEYQRTWRKSHKKHLNEYHREWSKSHRRHLKEYHREWWQKNSFGGMRDVIFKRDNNECQICGQKEGLEIHHWNKKKTDNSYWNLLTLCRSCHKYCDLGKF